MTRIIDSCTCWPAVLEVREKYPLRVHKILAGELSCPARARGTGIVRSLADYLNRGMDLPVVDTGFWNSAPDGYDLSGHSPQRVKPIFW